MVRAILKAIVPLGLMTAVAFAGQPIALTPSPPLSPNLTSFPRLVAAGNNLAGRVNAALDAADARAIDAAHQCLAQGGSGHSDWSRSVVVTMRGPRYLSLVADDDWYCGGPHPDGDRIALVYDLSAGAPVDWARLLPAFLVDHPVIETAGDGTQRGLVSSKTLKRIYTAAANHQGPAECAGCSGEHEFEFHALAGCGGRRNPDPACSRGPDTRSCRLWA